MILNSILNLFLETVCEIVYGLERETKHFLEENEGGGL